MSSHDNRARRRVCQPGFWTTLHENDPQPLALVSLLDRVRGTYGLGCARANRIRAADYSDYVSIRAFEFLFSFGYGQPIPIHLPGNQLQAAGPKNRKIERPGFTRSQMDLVFEARLVRL